MGSQQRLWKALWRMPVPNKIKVFKWRACKDSLPSKVKLVQKQVITTAICRFCDHPIEDLLHALFSYGQLRDSWFQYFPSLANLSPLSFFDLAMFVIDGKDLNKLALFFCIAWGFWYRRNKMEFDNTCLSPSHVITRSLGLLNSYKSVSVQSHVQIRHHFSWKPPPPGVLKLNTDGAMFSDLHMAGVGVILHDSAKEIVMAASKLESEVEEPEAVELLAILRGMQLCSTMGILHIEIESDCLLLVNSLQQNNMINSMLGNLFTEVKRLCSCFISCSFTHVYREGNRAAHKLARNAWRVENIVMWWDCIPYFLSQTLWFDKCL